RWDATKRQKKHQRFSKIVKEASEQSERNKVPEVQPVKSLKEIVQHTEGYDVKMFAHAEEARTHDYHSLGYTLKQTHIGEKIVICIGPEGGFSDSEVALLTKHHFSPVRLGQRIL